MPTVVYLANRDAFNAVPAGVEEETGEVRYEKKAAKGKRRVEAVFPDEGWTAGEMFTAITHPSDGIYYSYTRGEDTRPAWVASSNPALAAFLAEHYGCEVRDPLPAGERGEFTDTSPATGKDTTG